MRHLVAIVALALGAHAVPGQAQTGTSDRFVDLGAIKPSCGTPFKYDEAKKACVGDTAALGAIKDAGRCVPADRLTFAAGACSVKAGKEPAPVCDSPIATLTLTVRDGKCVADRAIPRSALGDYEGDCFRIAAVPASPSPDVTGGDLLKVLSQTNAGDDRILSVADAEWGFFGCQAKHGAPRRQLLASELNALGPYRYGWSYGFLTLPFKFYLGARTIGSPTPLGGFVGWRTGHASSALTFAVSAGLGTVKGEVRDAAGNVTSTPDLSALSYGAGLMWDIRKSTANRPFKIGLFAGADRVSADKVVTFPQNGKTWLAFQVGFDFADN